MFDKAHMTGLEIMHAIKAGEMPDAPVSATLGFRITEVEQGRVVIVCDTDPAHFNPAGRLNGGYLATLLDACMSCAIISALPAGQMMTTLEFKISFMRGIAKGRVTGEGKIINVGRRVATAEGWVRDEQGKLAAHATATCMVMEIGSL